MLEKHKPLIPDWRRGWKLWSVQFNTIGLGLMAIGEFARNGVDYIPPGLMARFPHAEVIGIIFFTLGIVSRLVKQKKKQDGGG